MRTASIVRTCTALGLLALSAATLARSGRARWSAATQALLNQLEEARLPVSALHHDARELDGLPPPVERYFRAVLQDGQPIVTGVTLRHAGSINMSATGNRWLPFTSRQQVTTRRPGFVWDARIPVLPGIPVLVHDAYVAGVGHLDASVLGWIQVARLAGPGEIARGELARYFAESVWYPTALLPSQGVRWTALDDRTAEATLTDAAVHITARFAFDDANLIESVSVAARGAMVGDTLVMRPWEGRMSNYQLRNGMRVPLTCEAAWLPSGERRPYWRGTIDSIAHEFAVWRARPALQPCTGSAFNGMRR